MNNLKYTPKVSFALVNFLLLVVVFILFFGRTKAIFKIKLLIYAFPDFYQHVSNFSISYLLYAGVGFFWLLLGVNFKYITGFGIVILLGNFIYEQWIPLLNTTDRIDAYYGFAGTVLAFLFLLITKKYGLIPALPKP